MEKIKLLFFGSDYMVGLTQALTEQLIEINKEDSVELYGVSSQNEMEVGLHDKIRAAGINMTIVNDLDVHTNLKGLAMQVGCIIDKFGITHVNVHNNWQLAIMAYLKYRHVIPAKFKIIYTIHGYRHNSFLKSLIAIPIIGSALMLFTNRVISMSEYVSKRFWFVGYKTDTVFYIMSKPEFNKLSNEIEGSPLRLVFPAQFRHGKNQKILIEAVADYIRRTNDRTLKLYLPGEGELEPKYKEQVKKLGLEDVVEFPGKLAHKNVIKLYEETNVALCSSNVETYGRCIAEPFALGRCLITRPTGVALDIVKDGENGFFFNAGKELTDVLVKLHNDPEIVVKTANQAFKDKDVFSRNNVIKTYLDSISKA